MVLVGRGGGWGGWWRLKLCGQVKEKLFFQKFSLCGCQMRNQGSIIYNFGLPWGKGDQTFYNTVHVDSINFQWNEIILVFVFCARFAFCFLRSIVLCCSVWIHKLLILVDFFSNLSSDSLFCIKPVIMPAVWALRYEIFFFQQNVFQIIFEPYLSVHYLVIAKTILTEIFVLLKLHCTESIIHNCNY